MLHPNISGDLVLHDWKFCEVLEESSDEDSQSLVTNKISKTRVMGATSSCPRTCSLEASSSGVNITSRKENNKKKDRPSASRANSVRPKHNKNKGNSSRGKVKKPSLTAKEITNFEDISAENLTSDVKQEDSINNLNPSDEQDNFQDIPNNLHLLEESAATLIQAQFRGYILRKKLKQLASLSAKEAQSIPSSTSVIDTNVQDLPSVSEGCMNNFSDNEILKKQKSTEKVQTSSNESITPQERIKDSGGESVIQQEKVKIVGTVSPHICETEKAQEKKKSEIYEEARENYEFYGKNLSEETSSYTESPEEICDNTICKKCHEKLCIKSCDLTGYKTKKPLRTDFLLCEQCIREPANNLGKNSVLNGKATFLKFKSTFQAKHNPTYQESLSISPSTFPKKNIFLNSHSSCNTSETDPAEVGEESLVSSSDEVQSAQPNIKITAVKDYSEEPSENFQKLSSSKCKKLTKTSIDNEEINDNMGQGLIIDNAPINTICECWFCNFKATTSLDFYKRPAISCDDLMEISKQSFSVSTEQTQGTDSFSDLSQSEHNCQNCNNHMEVLSKSAPTTTVQQVFPEKLGICLSCQSLENKTLHGRLKVVYCDFHHFKKNKRGIRHEIDSSPQRKTTSPKEPQIINYDIQEMSQELFDTERKRKEEKHLYTGKRENVCECRKVKPDSSLVYSVKNNIKDEYDESFYYTKQYPSKTEKNTAHSGVLNKPDGKRHMRSSDSPKYCSCREFGGHEKKDRLTSSIKISPQRRTQLGLERCSAYRNNENFVRTSVEVKQENTYKSSSSPVQDHTFSHQPEFYKIDETSKVHKQKISPRKLSPLKETLAKEVQKVLKENTSTSLHEGRDLPEKLCYSAENHLSVKGESSCSVCGKEQYRIKKRRSPEEKNNFDNIHSQSYINKENRMKHSTMLKYDHSESDGKWEIECIDKFKKQSKHHKETSTDGGIETFQYFEQHKYPPEEKHFSEKGSPKKENITSEEDDYVTKEKYLPKDEENYKKCRSQQSKYQFSSPVKEYEVDQISGNEVIEEMCDHCKMRKKQSSKIQQTEVILNGQINKKMEISNDIKCHKTSQTQKELKKTNHKDYTVTSKSKSHKKKYKKDKPSYIKVISKSDCTQDMHDESIEKRLTLDSSDKKNVQEGVQETSFQEKAKNDTIIYKKENLGNEEEPEKEHGTFTEEIVSDVTDEDDFLTSYQKEREKLKRNREKLCKKKYIKLHIMESQIDESSEKSIADESFTDEKSLSEEEQNIQREQAAEKIQVSSQGDLSKKCLGEKVNVYTQYDQRTDVPEEIYSSQISQGEGKDTYMKLHENMDPNLGVLAELPVLKKKRREILERDWKFSIRFAEQFSVVTKIQSSETPTVLLMGGVNPYAPTDYLLGGAIFRYHLPTDVWEYCGLMPEPRTYHAAALLHSDIYVTGGYSFFERNKGEMVATRTTFGLNIHTSQWENKAMMIHARACHSVLAAENKLFVFGGRNDQGRILTSVEIYNCDDDTWKVVTNLPQPLIGAGITCLDKQIWVVGGLTEPKIDKKVPPVVKNVYVYDIQTNSWTEKKSLPRPLAFCKVLTVRRKIWVLAGCTYKSTKSAYRLVSVSEIHVFNPTKNIWKRQPNLPGPRHSVASCKIGNKILLLGGMTSLDKQAISDLDIYDIEEEKFKNGAMLPCPLTGAVALEIPQERDWVKAKWFWEDPDINQLNDAATTIQTAFRGYQTRKKYVMKKQTIVEIQERELERDDSIVTVELLDKKSQNTQYESLESSVEQLFIQEEISEDVEHIDKEDFSLKIHLSDQASQREQFEMSRSFGRKLSIKKDVSPKLVKETSSLQSEKTPQKTEPQYQTPWQPKEHIFIQKDSFNIENEEEDNSLKIKIEDKLFKPSQIEIPLESPEKVLIKVIPDRYDPTISSAKESFFTYEESTSGINYQHMQKDHIHADRYKEYFRLVPQMDQNLRLLSSLEQERKSTKSSILKEVNYLPTFAGSLKKSKHIQDRSFPVIVVLGGIDPQNPNSIATGQTVLRYHPFKDRWEFCGMIPEPRNYHAAVFLNNAIYVSGGYDPERIKYGEMVSCNKMWAFDIYSKHWEKKANMMAARACHGMIAIHQKLYVVGGRGGDGRLLSSLEEYDPTDDAWRPERPMLFPRMGMMVVTYKKMIWVCGGIVECCPNANRASLISNVACYDPLTDQWFNKQSLPEPRAFASAIIVDNEMWLCGGCIAATSAGNYFVSSPSINVYDNEKDEWFEYDVLDVPRHAGAGVNLDSCLFFIGGMSSQTWGALARNELYIYEDALTLADDEDSRDDDDEILVPAPLPIPLTGLVAVVVPAVHPAMSKSSFSSLLRCKVTNYRLQEDLEST
ncbi:uncharacterized protein LOC143241108 [Tachypleus tridentatus]|uniref:uncharacterized protein LOC143241108 n=1 Tax=Tachypleus tridentatus TaxID=6853 RepID=UPI003FCF8C10